MRRARLSLGVISAAAVTMLVSVFLDRAAGLAAGWWQWGAAAVGTALGGGALTWWLGKDRTPPRLDLRLTDENGEPPRVAAVAPTDLGVHPPSQDEYLPRAVDQDVLAALAGAAPLVIVVGPRLAGCTRTLVEAARQQLPTARAVVYCEDPAIGIRELMADAARWADAGEPVVLWLDGITADRLRQLDAAVLDEFRDSVRVLATADTATADAALCRLHPSAVVVLHRDDRPGVEPPLELFERALQVTDDASRDRVAVLRAATDWQRLGGYGRLTERTLEMLYRAHRSELGGAPSVHGYRDALRHAVGSVPPLLADHSQDGRVWYLPHPLLSVIADDEKHILGWPITERLWAHLAATLDVPQRVDLGTRCLAAGDPRHAAQLLESVPVAELRSEDLLRLGYSLHRCGQLDDARRWYRHAVAAGDPDHGPTAMVDLGVLAQATGRVGEARRWFGKAIASGHPDQAPAATVDLGVLESRSGEIEASRRRYDDAIGSAHRDQAPRAMVNLGVLERRAGRAEEARHWFTEAIATEHRQHTPTAMVERGILEIEDGRLDEARHWLDKAVSSGHPDQAPRAIVNLGFLDRRNGCPDEARRHFTDAIATGHPRWAAVARGALAMPATATPPGA